MAYRGRQRAGLAQRLSHSDPLLEAPVEDEWAAIRVNAYRHQVAGFYWFALYDNPADLQRAHDEVVSDVIHWLGPVTEAASGTAYWRAEHLIVQTCAHSPTDVPGRQQAAMLQVHIDDTVLGEAQEMEARQQPAPPR